MSYDEMEVVGPYLRRFWNIHDRLWYYYHQCPACKHPHQYVVASDDQCRYWKFNHNVLKPTFYPSMRRESTIPRTPEEQRQRVTYTECHYFVRDGMIDFCTDSPHHLAGKTVPLPEWPKKK